MKNSDKKTDILKAAKKVVAEQGFDKLTYRAIAKEANISPGTLYYYYRSKDDLLYDIMDSSTRELSLFTERIAKGLIKKEEIPDHLLIGAESHVKSIDRNKVFLHVLHEALTGKKNMQDGLVEKYESWIANFEKLFQLCYDIPEPMSHAMAIFYDALIDGLLLKELLGLDPFSRPGVKELLELILKNKFKQT